jgi:hypothetical protein
LFGRRQKFREFLEIIAPFMPSEQNDRWSWLNDDVLGFTTNSAYLLLVTEYIPPVLWDPAMLLAFKYMWKCEAPSKVCAFSWQLLLDRIQTKDNLLRRRIIQVEQGQCVICGGVSETALHLFLHCKIATKIWYDIMRWLGFVIILPHNLASSLAMLIHSARSKKEKVGLSLIWCAVMWVIWNVRNGCIFNNDAVFGDDMVEQIKILSWRWYIGKVAKGPFLLYEWKWSPLDCMTR